MRGSSSINMLMTKIADNDAHEDDPAIQIHIGDQGDHLLGDPAQDHEVAEDDAADEYQKDHGSGADRGHARIERPRPCEAAQGKPHDGREEGAESPDLRRSSDARVKKGHDEENDQQTRPYSYKAPRRALPREPSL